MEEESNANFLGSGVVSMYMGRKFCFEKCGKFFRRQEGSWKLKLIINKLPNGKKTPFQKSLACLICLQHCRIKTNSIRGPYLEEKIVASPKKSVQFITKSPLGKKMLSAKTKHFQNHPSYCLIFCQLFGGLMGSDVSQVS